jgi:hypothetical protein
MAKEKKTIQVEFIKNFANLQLANPNNSIDAKLGVIAMLEKVLSEANVYKGYMYLSLGPNNTPPEFGIEGWASRKYF